VSASGTGLQEVISLIARNGAGVAHGIGVGGRDLLDTVGGVSTLTALDMLADDPQTRQVVLISKPPGPHTAERVYARLAELGKPATVCTFGLETAPLPASVQGTLTLQATVEACLGQELAVSEPPAPSGDKERVKVHGLYSGGTLCSEALAIFQRAGVAVSSNVSLGPDMSDDSASLHRFKDLGADEYTVGRPHPMIDPQTRNAELQESLRDPAVAVILLDVVLGYGAHPDPAAAILETLALVPADQRPTIVASVCGTDADPQNRSAQVSALRQHDVAVAGSNAEAAQWALQIVSGVR
jgi:FdrA protein